MVTVEGIWSLDDDVNTMWEAMKSCIKRVVSSTLGVFKRKGVAPRGTWWWDDVVKKKIKEKRLLFRNLSKSQDAFSYKRYKLASKEAKKAIKEMKNKFFDGLYEKLDTREGENEIYKIVRRRGRSSKDING
ncbi:uncharacterized protein [Rutidosis leptorrhynchoides]|uniref:uncharacterized protein n=1 Tax=Rutidosis leptorrhynchoides TaxID=125765 RepID=UPI003A9A35EE